MGNASIERPSQRSNSASVPAKSDAALALPSEAPARAVSDSVFTDNGNTDIARARSPSVLSTDGSEMDTRRGHDTLRQAALTAATMQREASRESDQSRPLTKHEQSAGTPSFIISSASEPVLALGEGGASAMPSLETKAPLEETLQLQGEDERDIIDSPSSLPHSTRSSLRSSRSDLVLPDIKKQGSGESHSSGLPHDHEFVSSTRQPPRDADSAPHRSRDLWLRLLRHREDQPAHRLVIDLFPVRTLQRHFRASSDLATVSTKANVPLRMDPMRRKAPPRPCC